MRDRTTLHRRQVIGGSAVAAVTGLTGCVGGVGGSPSTIDVSVTNRHDEPHTIDVQITFGEQTLLDRQFTVDPDGEDEATFENPEESGQLTVSAELQRGDAVETEITAGEGSGLSSVDVEIDENGDLSASAAVR